MKKRVTKSYSGKLLAIFICLALALTVAFTSVGMGANINRASAAVLNGNTAFSPVEGMTTANSLAMANAFNERAEGEGAVLLMNNMVGEADDAAPALPLAEDERSVTIFGKNSTNMVFGGSGSSGGGTGASITQAMEAGGFAVNPAMAEFYSDTTRSGANRLSGSGVREPSNWSTRESGQDLYVADTGYNGNSVTTSYADNYRDAAVVVFSRIGGEGFDLLRSIPADTYGRGDNAPQQHYLELDENEKALLTMIRDAGFQKTIVLLNVGTSFECTALIEPEYGVDAVLWVGFPGGAGLNAIPRILTGEINPSGHTVSAWETDFTAGPSVQDFSSNDWSGATSANGRGHTYNGTTNTWGTRYQEGIYLGYRYYETRAFVESQNNESTWNYSDHVLYPMGYGMSYTNFTWEVDGPSAGATITADGTLDFEVTVRNTGSVAGKDVVQLYYSAPYTTGGIEKSHVVLGGFAKTDVIAPGASDTVTISMPVREMASYDYNDANGNGFRGYELEAGAYTLYVGNNSHAWAEGGTYSVTVNVEGSGTTEFARVASRGTNGIAYRTHEASGNPIVNLFDDVSFGWGWEWEESEESEAGRFDIMSRADFEGTFPVTPTVAQRVNSHATRANSGTTPVAVNAVYDMGVDGNTPAPWYTTVEPTTAATAVANADAIVLGDLVGLEKDNELWNDFLDQFTIDNLRSMTNGFFVMGSEIAALGVPTTRQNDGPTGFTGMNLPSGNWCRYVSPIVISSTWNVELAEEQGEIMGSESLLYNSNGMYAPAMNTHRTPFSGRNFEYYSEDGLLAGKIASAIVIGQQSKGCIPAIKHFALNDHEQNRSGIATWATEQSMREIYFKAFEIPVVEGKALSVMSSYNRLGETHASDSYALLTELLRDEWGFEGYVVTDWYSDANNINAGIRTGNDIALRMAWGTAAMPAGAPADTEDAPSTSTGYRATHIAALRNAAHNVLYVIAQSNAMFYSNYGTTNPNRRFHPNERVTFDVSMSRSSNTTAAITYGLAEGSILPQGWTLDANTGVISGRGTFRSRSVEIDVMQAGNRFATVAYTLSVAANEIPTVSDNGTWVLDDVDTGAAASIFARPNTDDELTFDIGVSDEYAGERRVSYALAEGSELPAGYTIDASTGVISGSGLFVGRTIYVNISFDTDTTIMLPYTLGDLTIPFIGENGNWFVAGMDTGIPARGQDGQDGQDGADGAPGENGQDGADGENGTTPEITIGENGNWFVNGVDTGVSAQGTPGQDGADGTTPEITIGENGNWFVNGEDTGVSAQGTPGQNGAPGENGQDGANGATPEITIGENGNWFVNGEDTGVSAQAPVSEEGSGCNSSIGIGGIAIGLFALALCVPIIVIKKRKEK